MNDKRSLTLAEHKSMAQDSLRRLLDLYEMSEAKPHHIPSMAIEIWNILCSAAMQQDLKNRKFPSPAMYKEGQKKELLLPLVGFQLHFQPPGVSFHPVLNKLGAGMVYDLHPFKTWWKKDIAHQPLTAPGESLRHDLIDLTRFGIVRLIRNKIAAHHDRSRPALMDELERSSLIKGWSFQMGGQTYRIDDGEFEIVSSYGSAILRQIAFETLGGFGMITVQGNVAVEQTKSSPERGGGAAKP